MNYAADLPYLFLLIKASIVMKLYLLKQTNRMRLTL